MAKPSDIASLRKSIEETVGRKIQKPGHLHNHV